MSRVLPILFNTDMVLAILDGKKTVTRRIIKNIPDKEWYAGKSIIGKGLFDNSTAQGLLYAPYQPGDILYVRETWCKSLLTERYIYRADGEGQLFTQSYDSEIMDDTVRKWKPSIHMPKEAARIWLRITDVQVKRLQEIDCVGAKMEGCDGRCECPSSGCDGSLSVTTRDYSVEKFQTVWDSTIKKFDLHRYGWEANPWVWVIEFERCEKPQED